MNYASSSFPLESKAVETATDGLVPLQAILRTEELNRRPRRAPDYETENRALSALVQALAEAPQTILQTLAEKVLEVFAAGSAGLSLLTKDGKSFYWPAIAGGWQPHIGGGTPRNFGPCGDVLDCNAPMLFKHWEWRYPYLQVATPLAEEGLLVPFYVAGKAVGTIWAISHDERRKFDAEDLRLLESLGRFASAAYHAMQLQGVEALNAELRRAEKTLVESESRFRQMIDALPAAIYTTDAEGRLTHFNQLAVEFSGRMPQLGTDEYCVTWRLYNPDGTPLPHNQCPMAIALKEGRAIRGAEVIVERPDGTRAWVTPYPTPMRDAEGKITGGINMVVDITERKKTEAALRESDRRKDEFLATLSHELRNPLAAIHTAVELLREAGGDAAVAGQAQGILARQVGHMTRLVDDLLELSRVTSGSITLQPETVKLADVVASAIETSKPGIESAGHKLEVSLPEEPVVLLADAVRLNQILANLLNNAARYTPPGGRIWLSVQREAGSAVVSVRDSGIGIAPEMLPRVFDMFTQGSIRNRPAQGGLGIGLSLARKLVEMHGGSIEARSGGLGEGSEFLVRLPLPAAQRQTVVAYDRRSSPGAAMSARRVLIVDDNVDAAESLGALLRLMGHEVRIAFDGHSAMAAASAHLPEVVLLDIRMPEMDGYTVAGQLRKERRLSGVRIVALTGHGHEEDRRKSREAGFDEHLVKPVARDALRTLLDRH